MNVRAMGVGRITDSFIGGGAKRKTREMKIIGWNASGSGRDR